VSGAGGSPVARAKDPEFLSRLISAAVLAALALAVTALGGKPFALAWAVAASFVLAEFLRMVGYRPLMVGTAIGATGLAAANLGAAAGSLSASLAAVLVASIAIVGRGEVGLARLLGGVGFIYALCVAVPVVIMRADPLHGVVATIWLYLVVWTTDIGAFLVGRALKGPKLWPGLSPNKTWSGLVGGTMLGVLVPLLFASLLGWEAMPLPTSAFVGATILMSLATHAGDLLESALKRKFDMKDSSQIIPGHGGFMDRLDGFALASVAALIVLQAMR
jgi:phosphatidate cytidylyltransferase